LRLQPGRNDFFKLQAASVLGSIIDYCSTILGVEILHVWYLAASISGNLLGGCLQFLLNRTWVFPNIEANPRIQALKFTLVFLSNILLSAFAVYILTACYHLNYLLSKTVVSVLLGVSYNYFMQKKFVFR
jgi:putative flippase GtrA